MPTDIIAPIKAVTVFTDRARVTRTTKTPLNTGETVLVLSGLPEYMEADSVRVSGLGAGVTIRGVDVKPDVLAEDDYSETRATLRNEAEALERKSIEFSHQYKTLESRLEYFKSLQRQTSKNGAESLLTENTSFERVTAVADYIHREMLTVYAAMRKVNDAWKEAHVAWQAAKYRLNNNLSDETTSGQSIHIAVDAEAVIEFTVTVEYIVKNASWQPLYDLRLLEDNQVELTYMAQISQNTGENWNEVRLTLSTARPALRSTLPKLGTWYVGHPDEQRSNVFSEARSLWQGQPGYRAAREAERARLMDARNQATFLQEQKKSYAAPPPPPKAQVQQATVTPSSSGAIVNYRIGTPVTVAGNGEIHKTTVTITGLKAELDYLTAPRLAPEAYLRATITNTSDYTLLPGEASVFHENDFVGKTQLKTIAPTEEFKVQLGVDDRIKIERELVKREVNTRLIGTMAQTHYRYEIRLNNLLPKLAKITVQEKYPLSRSSKINVKLAETQPAPNDETDLQVLTWELELAASSKKTIMLEFIIEHGRNMSISGLID